MPESQEAFDIPSGADTGAGQDSIGSDVTSLRDASHELAERRRDPAESEPVRIDYKNADSVRYDKDGQLTGTDYDPRGRLQGDKGLHRAADDLTVMRENIGKVHQAKERAETAAYADYLRAGLTREEAAAAAASLANPAGQRQLELGPQEAVTTGQQQNIQWPQNRQAAQPQGQINWMDAQQVRAATPAIAAQRDNAYQTIAQIDQAILSAELQGQDTTQLSQQRSQWAAHAQQVDFAASAADGMNRGLDPIVAHAMAIPVVKQAVERELDRYQNVYGQYMQAAYDASQQAYKYATASAAIYFPEMVGLTNEQLPMVLEGIERTNPDRAQQIRRGMGMIANTLEHTLKISGAYLAHDQDRFNYHAKQQDDIWDSWHPEHKNPETARRTAEDAGKMLNAIGLSNEDIRALYNTHPLFRSAQGQEILWAATQFYKARQSVHSKRIRPTAPRVQRPGSPADRAPDGDRNISERDMRLNVSGSLKDATALLNARRAGARRR